MVNEVLPSSLGHYTILFVSRDLLPEGSGLGGDSSAVYVSQYRHAIIGTDSGGVCTYNMCTLICILLAFWAP